MRLRDLLTEDVEVLEAGAGLNRVLSHIQDGRPFIMMSAARPDMSNNQINSRMQQLQRDLTSAGMGVIRLEGVWEGESEPSFFAVSKDTRGGEWIKQLAVHLGKRYDQDATISGDGTKVYLLGQDGSVWEEFDAATIDRQDLSRLPGKSRIKGKNFSLVRQNDPEVVARDRSRIDVGTTPQ